MDKVIRLLAAVPTPPPYAGPEIGMELLIRNWKSEQVRLIHVRTTIRRSNAEKGRLDWRGIWAFIRVWWQYWWALWRWRPRAVFLLLSSSWVGFLRDSVMIVSARIAGSQVLIQYRGGNFQSFYQCQSRWRQWFIEKILGLVQRVFVQSKGLQWQFAHLVPWGRLRVLPNGISLAEIPERRRKVAEQMPYRLLFVGHIAFAKGFRELARAYQQLCMEFPVELWVIGTRISHPQVARSFLPAEWQRYYDEHSVEIEAEIDQFLREACRHNVRLLGIVSPAGVHKYMAEADVFVLPSYSEGFSMAVLEAMAVGLPVVVTRVGALGEVIVDGVHGRLVPVGDEGCLVKVLRECLQHPEWLREVGERNQQYVADNYTVDRILPWLESEVQAVVYEAATRR